ncbi:NAD-dependent epimerase/dehydratase family protein [uncultured Tenacibaculum sp.]|uniref:NAD-dependent epimerase/dehydratase family protein n=1 Tax=uncultured Tenacibaculum sp. TaxID=174713 RepID=UPI00262BDFCF|nr:NAD-dependent epimerase/dehydratase family protein [uncultured Tenacibaculum sp.]
MKVLVTGANGLLATNIIAVLLQRDYSVIGLLRNEKSFALEPHENLILHKGDITKVDSYDALLPEIDCIIHAAALTGQDIIDYSVYQEVNATATENLYKSALENNVKNFIYISTANCFGFGSLDDLGNEEKPIRFPFSNSLYAKSKLEGQEKLLRLAKDNPDTKLVTLNPTFMIGSYDTKPSSGRLVLSAYNKRVLFYPPGGKSFINVIDAAEAVVNSIELGVHCESYILCGENLSYKEFYQKVTKQLNQKSSYVKIPKFLLYGIGYIGNLLRFFKVKTDISLTNVQTLCINNFYSNKKAQEKLKLQQRSIDNGISDAIKWFKLN